MRRKAISMKRLSKEELRIGALLYPERNYWRPATRGDCANVARPCPYVGCRHHLYLDVTESGALKVEDGEPWDMKHSCSLDVADEGGLTLDEVGQILGLTRERVRQIEERAAQHYREARVELGLAAEDLSHAS